MFLSILLVAAVSVIIINKNSDKKNNMIAEKYTSWNFLIIK